MCVCPETIELEWPIFWLGFFTLLIVQEWRK
jgi:hypothetical protein